MLSKALNLDVTGEGIETDDQVALLQGLGCNIGQGFFFAKPLASDAIAEIMASGNSVPIQTRNEGDKELIERLLRAA